MLTERKLLNQDDSLLKAILSDLPQFKTPGRELVEAYEDLKLSEFSNDILDELKTKGASGIQARYSKQASDDISRMGIQNETLKNAMLSNIDGPIKNLSQAWSNLLAFQSTTYGGRNEKLELRFITYENGSFVVNADNKEKILDEYCRIYLAPGVATELYETLEKMIAPYQDYVRIMKSMNLNNELRLESTMLSLDRFFTNKGSSEMKVTPTAVEGVMAYKGRFDRYNK